MPETKGGAPILTTLLIILVALLGAYVFYIRYFNAPKPAEVPVQHYTSATYGYSFEYPSAYQAKIYTPEIVAIGNPEGDGFASLAEIVVSTAESAGSYADWSAYAEHQAEITCDADGPTASIRCPEVASSTPFTSMTGLSGEVFYLKQVWTKLPEKTTTTFFRGPYISYNISANVPQKPYAVLLVMPPPASESPDASLIEGIADSMQIQKLESRAN